VKRTSGARPVRTRLRPPRVAAVASAADAIANALAFRGLSDEVRAQRVVTEWTELVGPKIASRTRPFGVENGALIVEVASSAWLHELTLLRSQLFTGLMARLGDPPLFERLELRLAGRRKRDDVAPPRPRRAAPQPRTPSRPASGAARESIVREVAAVADDELRELIARVRITHDR
jgi:hypothetical protein